MSPLACALDVSLWPHASLARISELDDQLTVTFDVEAEDVPDYVCVLSAGHPGSPEKTGADKDWFPSAVDLNKAPNVPLAKRIEARSSTRGFPETLRRALGTLHPPTSGLCGDDHLCYSPITWGDGTRAAKAVLCGANAKRVDGREGPGDKTLVVLRVDLDGGEQIKQIHVDRNIVRLDLSYRFKPKEVAVVDVTGGHYSARGAALNSGERVNLSLQRTCRKHIVSLPQLGPRVSGAEYRASVRKAGGKAPVCGEREIRFDGAGHAQVWLPLSEDGAMRELDVDPPGRDSAVRFSAWWFDTRATTNVRLLPMSLSFSWLPPCIAQKTACPRATVVQAGIRCKTLDKVPSPSCRYECPEGTADKAMTKGPVGAPGFELPVDVSFSDEYGHAWRSRLADVGQELDGYLEPGERYVTVDFAQWGDLVRITTRPWERIDRVEVRGSDGTIVRLRPLDARDGLLRVRIPGTTCDDHVSYQIVGDREYVQATSQVSDGRVTLAKPVDMAADVASTSVVLGFGGYSPWGSPLADATRPYGLVEGIISFRPLPTGADNYPSLSLLRPWFEVRGGYLFSSQWYLGVSAAGSGGRSEVLYSRYPAALIAEFPLPAHLYFGLGPGVSCGDSLRVSDRPYVGGFQCSPTFPNLIAGYRPNGGALAFEVGFRIVIRETMNVFSTDFRGTPTATEVEKNPWFLDLRMRIGR